LAEGNEPSGERVDLELKIGEASLHAWRTVHSSPPNSCPSGSDRVGLAIRYMAADVSQEKQVVKDRVTLASGEYQGDCFEIEQIPSVDFGPEEWKEHKLSLDREWERRRISKQLGLLPSYKSK